MTEFNKDNYQNKVKQPEKKTGKKLIAGAIGGVTLGLSVLFSGCSGSDSEKATTKQEVAVNNYEFGIDEILDKLPEVTNLEIKTDGKTPEQLAEDVIISLNSVADYFSNDEMYSKFGADVFDDKFQAKYSNDIAAASDGWADTVARELTARQLQALCGLDYLDNTAISAEAEGLAISNSGQIALYMKSRLGDTAGYEYFDQKFVITETLVEGNKIVVSMIEDRNTEKTSLVDTIEASDVRIADGKGAATFTYEIVQNENGDNILKITSLDIS